jgi:hypothetical protein
MKTRHLLALPVLLSPAHAGDAKSPARSGGDWEFSISAGPAYRHFGTIKTQAGYRSGGLAIPSLVGSDSLTTPPIFGPGLRSYSDGYVGEDAATLTDGETWNWGYDRADQIDTPNDQLVFTATGFQSIRTDFRNAPLAGPLRRDDLDGFAPRLQFNARSPHTLGNYRLGFSAGFEFTNASQSLGFSNFSLTQVRDDYRLDYEDRYALDGTIPPAPGYQGTAAGPGPIIGYNPSGSTMVPVLIFTESSTFTNDVSSSVDINSLTLNFGPSLSRTLGKYDFSLSAGLTLNVYAWKAQQAETLRVTTPTGTSTFAEWSESDKGIKTRGGIYLQGDASYAVTPTLGIIGFLRLDTARDFSIGSGTTRYAINPDGLTSGIMLRLALP